MKIEQIKIGKTYYYNNRPVTVIAEEGETGFFRCILQFNVDTDISGECFCHACQLGGMDGANPSHSCGDAKEFIINEYKANTEQISLVRTSEVFIKEREFSKKEKVFYPKYKDSYISHIILRT